MRKNVNKNVSLREYASKKGVCLWEVSEKAGYKWPQQFSVYLRRELSNDEKTRLFKIIDMIAAERETEV